MALHLLRFKLQRCDDALVRLGRGDVVPPGVAILGSHQNECHARVAPMRARKYDSIFRSPVRHFPTYSATGISGHRPLPGEAAMLVALIDLNQAGRRPWDRGLGRRGLRPRRTHFFLARIGFHVGKIPAPKQPDGT